MRAGRGEHLGRILTSGTTTTLGWLGTDVVATEALLVLRDNLAGGGSRLDCYRGTPRRHPYESTGHSPAA